MLQHVVESLEIQKGGSCVCVHLFYFTEHKHITGLGNEQYDQPLLHLLRYDDLMTLSINFNTFSLPSHQILKEPCMWTLTRIPFLK